MSVKGCKVCDECESMVNFCYKGLSVEIIRVERGVISEFLEKEWDPYDRREFGHPASEIWEEKKYSLAAYEGGQIVGAAAIEIEGGVGKLDEIIVASDWRGQGVGGQLLARFEELCRGEGCHKVRLLTLLDSDAQPFYEKHGYTVEAILRGDWQGRDWVIMAKFLIV